ncbi:uncharacterized protein EDB91DRAFT_1087182 [Suillus paluster]|uniref:uncharacterized protein n=1 Tax=Suillus paluster TaxID=48578 RepID=UPI001B86754C|nr:uncharacterized protein EDB91DRAFT_1087182 [Suillus paluster]KAG1725265.1 hypothetical protein EDB91DRAFT_1087182 [Suillus paluster]
MASRPKRQTLLFPFKLGSPSQYDKNLFPLSRVPQGKISLNEVDFVLEATLDELVKIRKMVGDAEKSQRLIRNAKAQYDELMREKEKLDTQPKSLNPMKIFSTYRSIRLLFEAGRVLYTEARSASEKMRRQLLSVNTEDVQPVDFHIDNDLPSDATIGGIAVSLPDSDSQLDESTASFFTEAASFIASQMNIKWKIVGTTSYLLAVCILT